MLFNHEECFVVDDALVTPEGVIDLQGDVFRVVADFLVALSDEDDPTVWVQTGNNESRAEYFARLNCTDLWRRGYTLRECGRRGSRRGHRWGRD